MTTDAPVTQKQLLQLQLDNQSQLFEQVSSVLQRVNDGFDEQAGKLTEVSERLARLEGEAVGASQETHLNISRTNLRLWVASMLVSWGMSVVSLVRSFHG